MVRRILGSTTFFLFITAIISGGCIAGSGDDSEAPAQSNEALAGGCRLVCPRCHPGEVCPMYACYEDCHAPPARCVDTMMCPIGYAWSQGACSCIPDGNAP